MGTLQGLSPQYKARLISDREEYSSIRFLICIVALQRKTVQASTKPHQAISNQAEPKKKLQYVINHQDLIPIPHQGANVHSPSVGNP